MAAQISLSSILTQAAWSLYCVCIVMESARNLGNIYIRKLGLSLSGSPFFPSLSSCCSYPKLFSSSSGQKDRVFYGDLALKMGNFPHAIPFFQTLTLPLETAYFGPLSGIFRWLLFCLEFIVVLSVKGYLVEALMTI